WVQTPKVGGGRAHFPVESGAGAHIFPLTRVTRIFQNGVFTKTMPAGPGGTPWALLCPRERRRAGRALRVVTGKRSGHPRVRRKNGNLSTGPRDHAPPTCGCRNWSPVRSHCSRPVILQWILQLQRAGTSARSDDTPRLSAEPPRIEPCALSKDCHTGLRSPPAASMLTSSPRSLA